MAFAQKKWERGQEAHSERHEMYERMLNDLARFADRVGAHRKETQSKANRSPARVEYARTCNRLKQKKIRGKISMDEQGAAAKAMRILEQAERCELTDDEMKEEAQKF